MTTEEAINVLRLKFDDLLEGEYMWLWNKREHDLDLTPAEDGKAISKAIKALKTLQRLEAYVKVVEATKADVVNIAILKAALKEEEE